MQRAATGLATVCAAPARRGLRRRVVLLVGTGDNGGDALYAGAVLGRPRRPGRAPSCWTPDRAHAAGLAALRRAGGRCSRRRRDARRCERADLVARRACVGIGGRGGLRPDAADARRARPRPAPALARRRRRPERGRRRHRRGRRARPFPAHATVTFGAVKPGLVVGDGRGYAGEVQLVDIGLAPARPAAFRLTDADVAARLPPPVGRRRQVLPGRGRRRGRSATYPGAGRALHRRGAAHPARAWSGTPAPRPTASGRPGRRRSSPTDGPGDAGRVQAWVVGPGHGHRRRRARRAGRGARHRPAGAGRRRRADDAGRGAATWCATAPRPPCSPRTTASSRGFGAEVGADRIGAARRLRRRPRRAPCCSRATPPSSPARTAPRSSTRPAPRGWPPPAPATCCPGSPVPLLATGLDAAAEAGAVAAPPARADAGSSPPSAGR